MWEAPQVPNSSIPKIAPTVEHKITLAYSFPILFGFGTCGASHIPEGLCHIPEFLPIVVCNAGGAARQM